MTKTMKHVLALGALAMVPLAAGCAATPEPDPEPAPREATVFGGGGGSEATDNTEAGDVLYRGQLAGVGELTVVDEAPDADIPSLGLLVIASPGESGVLPRTAAGLDATPYDILHGLDPNARLAPRILQHHVSEAATSEARALAVVIDPPLMVTDGSCATAQWQSFFDYHADALGGVGTRSYVSSTASPAVGVPAAGFVDRFGRVALGACFVSQADGHDDITVRIERRVNAASPWSTVTGTSRTLHTSGPQRYIYRSGSSCSSFERRIAGYGLPAGGIYPADRFHLAGAWGGLNGCNLAPN